MATPIPDSRFVGILKAEGCKVHQHAGWQTHNRAGHGAWGPINGVIIHHTGSDTSGSGSAYNSNVLWSGYSGLPGPLCHGGLAPDGTLWINSNGRANHAGGGDPSVLSAVTAEASWLMSREAKPARGNSNGVDGNSHFYGLEVMYSGSHSMAAVQYDQAVRFAAAICRFYGWSARSVIGHREWSRDKIDPGHCDMTRFRAAVQARLGSSSSGGAGGAGGGGPTAQGDEIDMASLNELKDLIDDRLHAVIGGGIEKHALMTLLGPTISRVNYLYETLADGIPAPERISDEAREKNPNWGIKSYEKNTNDRIWDTRQVAYEIRDIIRALAEKGGLSQADLDGIAQAAADAARQGAADAIDAKITDADVTLTAAPEQEES